MSNLESFRQQYGVLHDASVGALRYQFPKDGNRPSLELSIQGYQLTEELPHPVRRLQLQFTGVKAFVLEEGLGSGHENLYGITYSFKEDHYHFDFATEIETSVEAMQKDSSFYIMCQDFSYEVVDTL